MGVACIFFVTSQRANIYRSGTEHLNSGTLLQSTLTVQKHDTHFKKCIQCMTE